MPNKWVEHVKKFARDNNMSYGCALTDPDIRRGYEKAPVKKTKAKLQDEEREKRQDEEEARVSAKEREEEKKREEKKRAEEEKKRAKGRALEQKYWDDVRAKEARMKAKKIAKKMEEEKKYWVFKPAKTPYGKGTLPRPLALMKAQRDDLKKHIEGLYKNDTGVLESFTIKDFKDVFLDDTPKPGTSQLLKIAKYLQKEELGKIRYLPAPAKKPTPSSLVNGKEDPTMEKLRQIKVLRDQLVALDRKERNFWVEDDPDLREDIVNKLKTLEREIYGRDGVGNYEEGLYY